MIDYTQYAFATPPVVTDPLPTVADYLRNYEDQERAWYESWAYPLGEGRYGARPESFDVRAPWQEPVPGPVDLPPVLRETGGNLAMASGDNRVYERDRPAGAMVRDPGTMTTGEIFSEISGLAGPQRYAGYPFGYAFGKMGEAGSDDRINELALAALGRATDALDATRAGYQTNDRQVLSPWDLLPEPGVPSEPFASMTDDQYRRLSQSDFRNMLAMEQAAGYTGTDRSILGAEGNLAFGAGDRYPAEYNQEYRLVDTRTPAQRAYDEINNIVYRGGGGGGYGGSSSDRDRGRDTYQGGEVGAGGWAGEGGL